MNRLDYLRDQSAPPPPPDELTLELVEPDAKAEAEVETPTAPAAPPPEITPLPLARPKHALKSRRTGIVLLVLLALILVSATIFLLWPSAPADIAPPPKSLPATPASEAEPEVLPESTVASATEPEQTAAPTLPLESTAIAPPDTIVEPLPTESTSSGPPSLKDPALRVREFAPPLPREGSAERSAPPPLPSQSSQAPPNEYVPARMQPPSEMAERPRQTTDTVQSQASARALPQTPTALSSQIDQAWNALNAHQYEEAARLYRSVLAQDANSYDGWRGLAYAYAASGQTQLARNAYREMLAHFPRDPAAEAALAQLGAPISAAALQAAQSSPGAAFALGNRFAAEGRWRDAQQQYFRALAESPDDPDYAYNLAVSLDQLGQAPLAARYYQSALELQAKQPARFDPAQAQRRLAELTGGAS
ncbi:tetratricopeptide repeat protein [Chitinibacteraceae bacterium HSL-7]